MEKRWEKRLNISTVAAAYEKDDKNHSRYEPTSYAVLERLVNSGWLSCRDGLVDYGCGKGRVGFCLNYLAGCRTIGVEYDERLHEAAMANLQTYAGRRDAMEFICQSAEDYIVPPDVNCFYFFNPFSVKILMGVLGRILESYYENPREIKLFFYYMLDEYRSLMMTDRDFSYAGEVDCRDLFANEDEKEKIIVFRME